MELISQDLYCTVVCRATVGVVVRHSAASIVVPLHKMISLHFDIIMF